WLNAVKIFNGQPPKIVASIFRSNNEA
ncbi:TPA: transposase, partial [Escherichia coli]|nr:transposase [Escherichia coli]